MLKKHFFYNEEAIVVAILWAWKVAYIWLKSQASAAEPPQELVSGTCKRHELEDRIPTHGTEPIRTQGSILLIPCTHLKPFLCRPSCQETQMQADDPSRPDSFGYCYGLPLSPVVNRVLILTSHSSHSPFFYLCLTQIPLMHQMLTVTVGEGRRATMWGGPDVGWQTSKTTDILCFFYLHNFS